jgi:hypothetical protein
MGQLFQIYMDVLGSDVTTYTFFRGFNNKGDVQITSSKSEAASMYIDVAYPIWEHLNKNAGYGNVWEFLICC